MKELTPEQEMLRQAIKVITESIRLEQESLYKLKMQCEDHFCSEYKEDSAAYCDVCGAYLGWCCKDAPNGHCEYPEDEYCMHCGAPEERK